VWERDDSWITLAARVFGLSERDLRDKIALGDDSVLLAIFIHVTRRSLRSNNSNSVVLQILSKLDIRNTLPGLQHDFCSLWNEIGLGPWNPGHYAIPGRTLEAIRYLYLALHPGTGPAPTASSEGPFADFFCSDDPFMWSPHMYPFCEIASHRPDSTPHRPHLSVPLPDALPPSPTDSGNAASRQAEQVNNVIEPPSSYNPTTTTSQDLSAIPYNFPINSGPPLTFAFPPAADVYDDRDRLRDSHDQNQTILMEVFHHRTQSLRLVPSPPDTASNSFEHEGD
jgi:hypothetical protein